MSSDSSKSFGDEPQSNTKKSRVKLTLKVDNNDNSHNTKSSRSTNQQQDQNEDAELHDVNEGNEPVSSLASPLGTSFSSTLPPRKRARTKEEKEQRRVERILRNRRAAHLSREKKKKYIEFLESSIIELVSRLNYYKNSNIEALSNISCASQHSGNLQLAVAATRSILERINRENIGDEKNFDDILDKINQSKNLNVVVSNPKNGVSNGVDSNPSTPTTPIFVYHNNANGNSSNANGKPRASNPSTPKTEYSHDDEALVDTANSLKKLSETPVQTSGDGAYNHHPITGNRLLQHQQNENVSGLGLALDNAPIPTAASVSFTSHNNNHLNNNFVAANSHSDDASENSSMSLPPAVPMTLPPLQINPLASPIVGSSSAAVTTPTIASTPTCASQYHPQYTSFLPHHSQGSQLAGNGLLNMKNQKNLRYQQMYKSPVTDHFKEEDETMSEENAVMIMMSLKNRNAKQSNGALQQHQYYHEK